MSNDAIRKRLAALLANSGSQTKLAQTSPEELGVAPPGTDPAAAAAAGGDPAAAGMPMGPPPTIDEMAAQGDPMATFFLSLKQQLDTIQTALGAIMDSADIQVPASQVMQQSMDVAGAQPKQATAAFIMPDEDDDVDDDAGRRVLDDGDDAEFDPPPKPAPLLPADQAEKEILRQAGFGTDKRASPPGMGSVGRPGEGGGKVIQTHMTPQPSGRLQDVVRHLKLNRGG